MIPVLGSNLTVYAELSLRGKDEYIDSLFSRLLRGSLLSSTSFTSVGGESAREVLIAIGTALETVVEPV